MIFIHHEEASPPPLYFHHSAKGRAARKRSSSLAVTSLHHERLHLLKQASIAECDIDIGTSKGKTNRSNSMPCSPLRRRRLLANHRRGDDPSSTNHHHLPSPIPETSGVQSTEYKPPVPTTPYPTYTDMMTPSTTLSSIRNTESVTLPSVSTTTNSIAQLQHHAKYVANLHNSHFRPMSRGQLSNRPSTECSTSTTTSYMSPVNELGSDWSAKEIEEEEEHSRKHHHHQHKCKLM